MQEWFVLGLSSAIMIGIVVVFEKIVSSTVPPGMLSAVFLTIAGIATWAYAAFSERAALPGGNAVFILVCAALLFAAANIFFLGSLKAAPNAGYPAALGSLSIVVTTVISLFVFGLNINYASMFGMFLMLAGAVVLGLYGGS